MSAGYSKTPLGKKLGYKEGFRVAYINLPANYFELFSDLPEVTKVDLKDGDIDLIHAFITTIPELDTYGPIIKESLKKTGMVWFSWPKGSSKMPTELNRDLIRTKILDLGLVDTKVCAVDEDWSGLKFVYRTKDR